MGCCRGWSGCADCRLRVDAAVAVRARSVVVEEAAEIERTLNKRHNDASFHYSHLFIFHQRLNVKRGQQQFFYERSLGR